jgi:hypothetical protein
MAMQRIDIGRWTLEADPVATASAYANLDKGGADECTCADCQYYRNHRDTILPSALREILVRLVSTSDAKPKLGVLTLGRDKLAIPGGFISLVD